MLQGIGQGLPLVETGDDLRQDFFHLGTLLFFCQGFQRLNQRQASIQQRQQFLAEQHERKSRLARPMPGLPGLPCLDRDNRIALRHGLACCVAGIRRIQQQGQSALRVLAVP